MRSSTSHSAPAHRALTAFAVIGTVLTSSFFERSTVEVARDLLGKTLVSSAGGTIAGGRIVETEAYLGTDDPGSHAATRGITQRNRIMYGPPGTAYVYFTYGVHHMLNLVTEPEGTAGAVLVRAIEPTLGANVVANRRGGRSGRDLADGPGKVAQALGVTLEENGTVLGGGPLAVLDGPAPAERVLTTGRIGLAQGHELPLRFYLEGSAHSRSRTGPVRRGRR